MRRAIALFSAMLMAGLLGLPMIGCNNTPAEKEKERIEDAAERQKDAVERRADQKQEAIEDAAERQKDAVERSEDAARTNLEPVPPRGVEVNVNP